jgi:hypothetical protein
MAPADVKVAARPKDPATQGKAIQLATNFYKVNFDSMPPVMHHDCRVQRLRFDPESRAPLILFVWLI